MLWPNADAGSEHIARGIRQWREHNDDSKLHFFKNLPTDDYIKLMAKTACLVGNSSSAIREGAFIGAPAVNIGPRQDGRDRGSNVVDVDYDAAQIADAVRQQVANGRYELRADLRRRARGRADRGHPRDEAALDPQADHVLSSILGLIPARGGSKGVPRKNLALGRGRSRCSRGRSTRRAAQAS